MKTIQQIQQELKDILPNGIDLTISAMKTYLPKGTDIFNDLLLLESRYRDLTGQMVRGVISNDDAQLGFNKLRKDILTFIDLLEEQHLKPSDDASVPGDIYNGELLYRIPKRMTKEVEEKCIVRLAFSKSALLKDFEEKDGDVTRDIRISDVMGVELLDPSAKSAFSIRTITDRVQWVEKDLPTEWIFYVKALIEGTHALVLKISVIEIKNGIERIRNVVLEESVEISASAPAYAGGTNGMEASGYFMHLALAAERPKEEAKPPGGMTDSEDSVHIPKMIEKERRANGGGALPPKPAPQPVVAKKSRFRLPQILTAIVVVLIASWAVFQFSIPNYAPTNDAVQAIEIALRKDSKEAYEHVVRNFPNTEVSKIAIVKLDSIETSVWEIAKIKEDTLLIRDYIRQYPSGKYLKEAEFKIIEKRNLKHINPKIHLRDIQNLQQLNDQ